MKLSYQIIGKGQPLVILHGLFGSSDNWRGLAKQLAKWVQVITVDLRNHGRSPHSAAQTYDLMAEDLAELFEQLNLDNVDIIGHSMGGKVAMAFSQRYPHCLRKLVVVDISPRQYSDEHSDIFKALLALDLSLYTRRSEVDSALKVALPNNIVRQFLLMNLIIENQQLMWRINLNALADQYTQLLKEVCKGQQSIVPCCFIRGGQSNYIRDQDKPLIIKRFPLAQFVTIEQAGHWVHADAPHLFLTKITEFFDYA